MSSNRNLLITGASGFLGSHLYSVLKHDNSIFRVFRKRSQLNGTRDILVPDLCDYSDWNSKLLDIDCIVHCAARAHVMNDNSQNPLKEYLAVNTVATKALANSAANAGVKRFIFISSAKVNGEKTLNGELFKSTDNAIPQDPYAISKYEAENELLKIANDTQMEVVIIRPPLVYGPGVKANFQKLIKLASLPIPTPLSSINSNKRSLVSIGNLCDLIKVCIDHPHAANKIFLVSDDKDLSTAELFKAIKTSMGKTTGFIKFPLVLFKFLLKLIGKQNVLERLTESFQVDIADTKSTLGWTPPYSVDESITKTTEYYLKNK